MLHALLLSLTLLPPVDVFQEYGPFDSGVTRPESVLGYGPGERHTTYHDQQRVVEAISRSGAAKVKYVEFGKSTEGRALRIMVISSPNNMKRLEEIRSNIGKLASGKAPDAAALIKNTPAVVWINECIHGNETASFESGMWLAHTLAPSRHKSIQDMLEKTVVVVNPSYNPDGHERYVVWYNSIATGSPFNGAFEKREPSVIGGRTNHYRFDMNRDRVSMSQMETRQEVAEFLRWNPQVYVDQHGQVDTFFFPPTAQATNLYVDRERYSKWTEIFGRASAAAFDAKGMTYYIKDIFDFYAPGYLDTWTTLSGAIGMTHETDGGPPLAKTRSDGSVLTLRQGMEKHYTAALAVINSAAQNRESLLQSFAKFKRDAVEGVGLGDKRYVVLHSDQPEPLQKLALQLSASGIESNLRAAPSEITGESLWTGKAETAKLTGAVLIVDLAQPQGALARSYFDPRSDFEEEFVKRQLEIRKKEQGEEQYPGADGLEFYDLTAWNLAFAHNLSAWFLRDMPDLPTLGKPRVGDSKGGSVGWIAHPGSKASLLLAQLLREGVRVGISPREMKLGNETHPAGSYIIFRSRQDEGKAEWIEKLGEAAGGLLMPLNTNYPESGKTGPGSESSYSLKKPEIGIVFGDEQSLTGFGGIWYTMDKVFKMPFTPLHRSALGGDLSRYSCIILPGGQYAAPPDTLRNWVQGGGCLILLGPARTFIGSSALVNLESSGETGYLPGSLFKAELDPRSFLSYGYPHDGENKIKIAVPIDGSSFYKKRKEGGSVIVLSDDEKETKLLSGWSWPDETEKDLRGTVWLHDQPLGQGRVIVFMNDPTERAMWPGLHQLLLNAILLGPRG